MRCPVAGLTTTTVNKLKAMFTVALQQPSAVSVEYLKPGCCKTCSKTAVDNVLKDPGVSLHRSLKKLRSVCRHESHPLESSDRCGEIVARTCLFGQRGGRIPGLSGVNLCIHARIVFGPSNFITGTVKDLCGCQRAGISFHKTELSRLGADL